MDTFSNNDDSDAKAKLHDSKRDGNIAHISSGGVLLLIEDAGGGGIDNGVKCEGVDDVDANGEFIMTPNELELINEIEDVIDIDNTYDTTSSSNNQINENQIIELNNFSTTSSNNLNCISNNVNSKNHAAGNKHGHNLTCSSRMQRIMRSTKLNLIVVILVVLDSICVSIELIIDIIVTMNEKNELNFVNSNILVFNNSVNHSNQNNVSHHHHHHHLKNMSISSASSSSHEPLSSTSYNEIRMTQFTLIENKSLHSFKQRSKSYNSFILLIVSFEEILKYIGLSILSLFVIEICLKCVFVPKDIIKSKWGLFDAFVVLVSFVLDIILLKNKQLLHSVSGLITLLRLWRITRIINGIVMTMEKKSADKVKKLVKIITKLQRENEELRQELSEKNAIIERLTNQSGK